MIKTASLVSEHIMTDLDGIGVYVGTYHKYNNGSIEGEWLDMATFDDADEFFETCRTLHQDEDDPEFMFQDFQGFPKEWYGESMNVDDIEKIIEYANLDSDKQEKVDDYIEYFGDYEDISDVECSCVGSGYDSMKDFCEEKASEYYDIPESLERFIDYEKMAEEFEDYYHIGSNGYVFEL